MPESVEDEEKSLALNEGWAYEKLLMDKRAFGVFERHLKLQGKIETVYVPHALVNKPGGRKSSAIQDAFPDAEILYLEEKTTDVEKHERYGHIAIRGHAETHRGEKVDLVVLFDTKVDATWQLLQNVGPHGYLISRAKHAAGVLKEGKFELKGVIRMDGREPVFIEDPSKFGQIETDDDLKNAERVEGMATPEEIREKVLEVYPGTKTGFVDKYRDLLQEAREQVGELSAARLSTLKWTGKVHGEDKTVELKMLPPKADEKNLWVFRKWNL